MSLASDFLKSRDVRPDGMCEALLAPGSGHRDPEVDGERLTRFVISAKRAVIMFVVLKNSGTQEA